MNRSFAAQALDLMQFINSKYHEPFIHEKIEFASAIDVNHLEDSINYLAKIFPILKCVYDSKNNMFITPSINAKLLLIKDDIDETQVLSESLNMNEKLVLFTLSKNILYITISHLICDGSGFKQLIYLLCDIYNEKKEVSYDNLMSRDFSLVSKNVKISFSMTLKMLSSMLFGYKNYKIYNKNQDEKIFIVERSLDKNIMDKTHFIAKQLNATLNDVFLTAYARSLSKLNKIYKINIPCTVDLRKYAKEKTLIANLTGTYSFNIKVKNNDNFKETLLKASNIMKKQKKSKNDIAGPMLLVSKYQKTPLDKFYSTYDNMNVISFTDFTNLGVIDDKRLKFNDVSVKNAIGYSSLQKAPYFQVAISSFNNKTTFSSIVRCSLSEKDKVDFILDNIIDEILNFIAK